MRVMGVDASSSCTGVTTIDKGKLVESVIWRPNDKKALASERLLEFYLWLCNKIEEQKPDVLAISSTSFSRNVNTTRVLSRYEGVAILAARQRGCAIVNVKDSEARKMVLKRGTTSKQRAYQLVTKREKKYPWLPYDDGGNDQTDSYVIAKAALALEYS
jgi:Holliday junction resolvasome RuvABC endonuclease subunit